MGLKRETGLTLIELMVSIAIIGTLAGIAVPAYSNYQEKARRVRVISEIKMLEKEIFIYFNDNDFYPETLADIGLETLKDPWGRPYQYLRIQSPAGSVIPEKVEVPSKKNVIGVEIMEAITASESLGEARKDHFLVPVNTDFDLYSLGPDGKTKAPFSAKDSQDDIVRANNGNYYGLASAY